MTRTWWQWVIDGMLLALNAFLLVSTYLLAVAGGAWWMVAFGIGAGVYGIYVALQPWRRH